MIVEKVFCDGSLAIRERDIEGNLFKRRYFGYTNAAAVNRFKQEKLEHEQSQKDLIKNLVPKHPLSSRWNYD